MPPFVYFFVIFGFLFQARIIWSIRNLYCFLFVQPHSAFCLSRTQQERNKTHFTQLFFTESLGELLWIIYLYPHMFSNADSGIFQHFQYSLWLGQFSHLFHPRLAAVLKATYSPFQLGQAGKIWNDPNFLHQAKISQGKGEVPLWSVSHDILWYIFCSKVMYPAHSLWRPLIAVTYLMQSLLCCVTLGLDVVFAMISGLSGWS